MGDMGGYPRYGFHPNYLSNPADLTYGPTEPPTATFTPDGAPSSGSSSSSFHPDSDAPPKQNTFGSHFTRELAGCWQYCNINGPFPPNMVRAGIDTDGDVIYVGRAFHEGDMIPAKVIPTKNLAYICYGGEEILKEDFEVLRYGAFVWEFATAGSVPETAVRIGQTADGEPLYMGRAIHNGSQTPGKVQPSHGCCYIPFGGEEISKPDYEVLCVR
uniref:Putative farnesoic acid o-methyltransferase-like protein n=3 Tax=Anopheles marajoara TaxID=58244 RepID=A0A2M4BZD0_9DIPT